MNKPANSPFNPFQLLQKQKCLTKNREICNNNPFQFFKREPEESSFIATIKLKSNSRRYHGFNPFINESQEKEEKAPFHKGEQNYHAIFKGLNKNNNISNITDSMKKDKQIIVKPNINIYICENYFENGPFEEENRNCRQLTVRNDKSYSINNNNINQEKNEDEDLRLTESLYAPAPAIEPINHLSDRFAKLTLEENLKDKRVNDKNLMKQKEVNENEKIYTNDGNWTLGKYYME